MFLVENGYLSSAGVTQLVECDLAKVDVAGSNPVSRSISQLGTFPRRSRICILEARNAWFPAVVHSVFPVLALGVDGLVSLSHCLAHSAAVPYRWHRRGRRAGTHLVYHHASGAG